MTDKQDVIVSLLKEIDKNIENLGGSETDVLLSNRITTLENSVKTINTDINGIKTTNTTQTTNITNNTNNINTANQNITNLTNELSTVQSNVSTNTSNIGTLTTDVNALKTTSATKTELNTTNTSLNTTNTNVSNLTTRVTNVENKATTNESNINTLNERVTTLENTEPSGGGGGITSGGYPVVTVEDDFNITAEPNTFYNIKNDADSEISITFGNDYFIDKTSKHLMFTGDFVGDETYSDMLLYCSYFGGKVYKDSSKEGYTHKLDVYAMGVSLHFYFSDEIKTGNNVSVYMDVSDIEELEEDVQFELNNIIILNEDINYLGLGTQPSYGTIYFFLKEVDNDNIQYKYKYQVYGFLTDIVGSEIYTNEPYYNAEEFYLSNGHPLQLYLSDVQIVSNISSNGSDVTNEFVFNINAPANIIFNRTIKWHNNTPPDLTSEGVCTISIVNGVGCYTFVND